MMNKVNILLVVSPRADEPTFDAETNVLIVPLRYEMMAKRLINDIAFGFRNEDGDKIVEQLKKYYDPPILAND